MSATHSYTILREIEGVQPLAKGHNEKMDLGKEPKPTSPSLLVCKSMHFLPLKHNSRKAGIGSSFPLGIQETD